MPTYVIGDIQGCYQSFTRLLKKIQFNPFADQLVLAGDMINRGSDSLATMNYILENQQSIRVVLGNHDLHFLAVAHNSQPLGSKDTFNDILQSSDRNLIVDWLSNQPLALYLEDFDTLVVHAGLPFNWSEKTALKYSQEISAILQSPNSPAFLASMYGNQPDAWSEQLSGMDRLRYITNALTRMRYCFADGRLELRCKLPPNKQTGDLLPWFELKNELYSGKIVFGHWASLQGQCSKPHIQAIDTGCVWGGKLTALRLEDNRRFQV